MSRRGPPWASATARLEMSQPRGLLLSPFITPDGRGMGFQMSRGL